MLEIVAQAFVDFHILLAKVSVCQSRNPLSVLQQKDTSMSDMCPAHPSRRSVDDNDLLLSSAEDNQLIAESVQLFKSVGELWDSAAEEDLVLLLSGHLAVFVPHSFDGVGLPAC